MDWYSHLWKRRIDDDDDQVEEFIRSWCVSEDCNGGRWIKHYFSFHRILLVGKGNLSFSACLAKAFGLATSMVVTSIDSLGFLSENYKDAHSNVVQLVRRGCNVFHGVYAMTMADHYALIGMRFDRIIFNFPLTGFDKTLSRSEQIKRNQTLLSKVFANALAMLSYVGVVHMVHKTNGFFQEWEIEKLDLKWGLHLIEESEFSLKDYPGYRNKYGMGRQGL
ncbi:uncharacterized protein At4g26485-like [Macadamia integrifolia]|uniref:uncharacterized protein At4g26485-like n=1 Tax=Macadamia integrifolia TaxID=60698 RepID=UPI001C52A457|nr:uncharacterized protein At4g26485-like [Macadamia integrifolia]